MAKFTFRDVTFAKLDAFIKAGRNPNERGYSYYRAVRDTPGILIKHHNVEVCRVTPDDVVEFLFNAQDWPGLHQVAWRMFKVNIVRVDKGVYKMYVPRETRYSNWRERAADADYYFVGVKLRLVDGKVINPKVMLKSKAVTNSEADRAWKKKLSSFKRGLRVAIMVGAAPIDLTDTGWRGYEQVTAERIRDMIEQNDWVAAGKVIDREIGRWERSDIAQMPTKERVAKLISKFDNKYATHRDEIRKAVGAISATKSQRLVEVSPVHPELALAA